MGIVERIDIGSNWQQVSARKWKHKRKRAVVEIKGNSPEYMIEYRLPSGRYVTKFTKKGSKREQELRGPNGRRIDRYTERESELMSPLKSAKLISKTYMRGHQNASPPTKIPR